MSPDSTLTTDKIPPRIYSHVVLCWSPLSTANGDVARLTFSRARASDLQTFRPSHHLHRTHPNLYTLKHRHLTMTHHPLTLHHHPLHTKSSLPHIDPSTWAISTRQEHHISFPTRSVSHTHSTWTPILGKSPRLQDLYPFQPATNANIRANCQLGKRAIRQYPINDPRTVKIMNHADELTILIKTYAKRLITPFTHH